MTPDQLTVAHDGHPEEDEDDVNYLKCLVEISSNVTFPRAYFDVTTIQDMYGVETMSLTEKVWVGEEQLDKKNCGSEENG